MLASPAEPPRTITYEEKEYDVVREGLAEILSLQQTTDSGDGKGKAIAPQNVFYNPIQQFNRDLSVLAIRVFAEDFSAFRKNTDKKSQLWPKNDKKRSRDPEEDVEDEGPRKSRKIHNGVKVVADGRGRDGDGGMTVNGATVECEVVDNPSATAHEDPNVEVTALESDGKEQNGLENAPNGPRAVDPPSFRILDALSATGLRALRYAKEISQVTSVTANDLSPSAVASIKVNVRYNDLAAKVHPITGNALVHMYYMGSEASPKQPNGLRGKYHVVDLDPYGTACPFLDAAIQATCDGGLLCVTCTDSAIFASTGYAEKTFSQYGGLPIKGPQSHEGGLRLLLHAIATTAARHAVAIEPLLSLSIDFYVRVFVRLRRSPSEVKLLAGKTMLVYNCDEGCGAWKTQALARTQPREDVKGNTIYKFSLAQAPTASSKCEHCGFKTHLSGPMWGGPLHNPYFIQRMLDILPSLDGKTYGTLLRLEGMLCTARDETLIPEIESTKQSSNCPDTATQTGELATAVPIPRLPLNLTDPHPFFFIPSGLAKVLHCESPSIDALRSALTILKYRTTRSHTKPGSLRTDAPWEIIWEIMREWARQKAPIREGAIKERTAGWNIMQKSRSNAKLQGFKRELTELAEKGGDLAEVKKSMEALLWRIEKTAQDQDDRTVEDDGTSSAVKENKHTASKDLLNLHDLDIIFDEALGKELDRRKLVRYQTNPRANWGPMSKAKEVV